MAQYPITAGVFGKALAVTGKADILSPSRWEFLNQSGITGTNLNGSQIYVGTAGSVAVIPADTVGAQDTVTGFSTDPITAGKNYFSNFGVPTTVTSLVHKSPANQPSGLTVDVTASIVDSITTAGVNYTTGAFTEANGLTGTLIVVGATGAIASVTITDFGTAEVGYSFDPVARGGTGGLITILSFGEVTKVVVANAGTNYSVGDIITIVEAGTNSDATYSIAATKSLLPTAIDQVVFEGLANGAILPVAVDYVLNTGTATNLIALR
tara:strand:- start:6 stop:806 length:801 start_codon:yes stop_codon:yes gene_type:complete